MISRRRFLAGAAAVGASAVLSGAAHAKPPQELGASCTVVGTNTYPADVNAVQTALDGTCAVVYLQGTFNFGSDGSVYITRSVVVQGMNGTTVHGGEKPFNVGDPGDTCSAPNGDVTIENIHFVEPNHGAIFVWRVDANKQLNIRNNRIEHSLYEHLTNSGDPEVILWNPEEEQTEYEPNYYHFTGIYTWSGSEFVSAGGYPRTRGYLSRTSPTVKGRLNIEGNYIDVEAGVKPEIPGTFDHWSFGIGSWGASAEMYISRNTIYNCSSKAIVTEDNEGDSYVQRNEISIGPVGSTRSSSYSTWGIDTEYAWNWYGDASTNYLEKAAGTYLVSRNRIYPHPCCTPVPGAFGIGAFGNSINDIVGDYRISDYSNLSNHIHLINGAWVISLGDQDRGVVSGNTIEGSADYAFYPFMYYYCHNTLYHGNKLTNFQYAPGGADVLFETYGDGSDITNNTVNGGRGYAIDQGQNNTFNGNWQVDYP